MSRLHPSACKAYIERGEQRYGFPAKAGPKRFDLSYEKPEPGLREYLEILPERLSGLEYPFGQVQRPWLQVDDRIRE